MSLSPCLHAGNRLKVFRLTASDLKTVAPIEAAPRKTVLVAALVLEP